MRPITMTGKRKLSLPARALALVALAAICQSKPAISISDQQHQQQVASERSQAPAAQQAQQVALPQPSAPSLPASAAQAQVPPALGATEASARTTRRPGGNAHAPQPHHHASRPSAGARARKATTPRHHHHSHQHSQSHSQPQLQLQETPGSAPTVASNGQEPPVEADAEAQQLPEAIRLLRNTPPSFVTSTRDFFVDVARFPLGHKLTTIQAVDLEGDRLEYALRPARVRDASPYFAINATSGELRLAHSRMPEPEPEEARAELAASEEGSRPATDEGGALGDGAEPDEGGALLDRTGGYLWHLNVEANDGHYPSVLELQIHVFNSTSLGTKSPVQLTIEGGRRGAENLMRAKTDEFFKGLYGGLDTSPDRAWARARPAASSKSPGNSSIVVPSFVNPTLVPPDSELEQEEAAPRQRAVVLVPAAFDASARSGTSQRPPASDLLEAASGEQAPHADTQRRHQQHQQQQQEQQLVVQQPMVLSLIIMISACLAIVFVLLLFVVPLSVKRLKRRLRNMELQHEQLSQKTCSNMSASSSSGGGGGSSSCVLSRAGRPGSSSAASFSGSTLATSGHSRAHLPSLSQFTLASGASGSVLHDHDHHHHQMHLSAEHYDLQRTALGRQSSLDSALTPSAEYNGAARPPPSYHFEPNMSLNPRGPARFAPRNGQLLNQINNGAIVNPVYLHQVGAAQAPEGGNIYCPIDDEHYSQINTSDTGPGRRADGGTAFPMVGRAQVGSLVGQTCDTRAYFASGCAAQPSDGNGDVFSHLARDSRSPTDSVSSRSSTRSLARFLSLPARHLAHQKPRTGCEEGDEQARDKRKATTGSFLAELEYHFKAGGCASAGQTPPPPALPAKGPSRAAQTIARTDRIGIEQQVRHKRANAGIAAPASNRDHSAWELERHRLDFLEIIGEGQFGLVWRCKLRRPTEGGASAPQTVAVKTLKKFAAVKGAREHDELLAEIEIMKLVCDHPNVVRLLHCCTRDPGPILLVMEFVELGKLQGFLEESRSSHHYATRWSRLDSDSEDNGAPACGAPASPLTSRDLIRFIYHIAKGMERVAASCIVHRDLASRNVLVSSQRVCKIADFGMARHVAAEGDVYERRSRNAKVPVRWMAPEVLLENSFTTKSDVFSFGILMWEIVTLGSTPYVHLKTDQIVGAVARRGERPERPEYCHPSLYALMSSCWQAEASLRPSFSELAAQLDAMLLSGEEYIELDQYSDHNYYNIDKTLAPLELL